MSSEPANASAAAPGKRAADTPENGGTPPSVTSDTLHVGDTVTEALLGRLIKLEKFEHKLAEVARVYRNLNAARKAVEVVLKKLTPVQSIADVEELEEFLSNLTVKSQYAGEQIGALTELDKGKTNVFTALSQSIQVRLCLNTSLLIVQKVHRDCLVLSADMD
ncbi:hypothetical protein COEREDRAFT_82880 [Coemansia reversa NRRL 1564]|uniref:Uncharacterized protein n=1 Tax=Coemansia reversa (strain ATCC 12441 / NRRL 1564) TaxID=763665 RepID=A0A2G5B5D1_COERN|nr:hypothetical protein COEREDRAFT_82880 [Coemansia reversa NRRL 1564]|eukprot:PIA14200.1 hypothetical protein COEREDRAFT_82880 [Coemansia reversa NRRL 1564]